MLRSSFCFLLLLFSVAAFAQDTIYVYETVYETDTVWLEESHAGVSLNKLESLGNATLLIDTTKNNATLVYFSPTKSATISTDRIYTHRNYLKSTKMKKAGFFTFMFLAVQSLSFGQKDINSIYNVGIGLANENNVSNYGIVFSNDYKKYLTNKIAINPRFSFFQSIGSFEPAEQFGYRSHSGLMLDLGLNWDIVRRNSQILSFVIGPTYEVGSDTYSSSTSFAGSVVVDQKYSNTKLNRFGLFADLEYCFYQKNKWTHSIAVRTNYFSIIYPEYLGIIYKVGFLNRNN